MDTSGIFLDALVEKKIVSAEFNSKLLSTRTDADRNTLLLDYMMKRSQRKLNAFIEVLQKENQTHVSELFRTKRIFNEAEFYNFVAKLSVTMNTP